MAVQTHALSHLHTSSQHDHHLDANQSHSDDHEHSASYSNQPITEVSSSVDEFIDCQIYHHYAGLNGVLTLPVDIPGIPKTGKTTTQIGSGIPARQFFHHKNIRAPPLVS